MLFDHRIFDVVPEFGLRDGPEDIIDMIFKTRPDLKIDFLSDDSVWHCIHTFGDVEYARNEGSRFFSSLKRP